MNDEIKIWRSRCGRRHAMDVEQCSSCGSMRPLVIDIREHQDLEKFRGNFYDQVIIREPLRLRTEERKWTWKHGMVNVSVDYGLPFNQTAVVLWKRIHRKWWNPMRWIKGDGQCIKIMDVSFPVPNAD